MPAPLTIFVYGNANLIPETRRSWPEFLTAVLSRRNVPLTGPVVNRGARVQTFPDVARAALASPDRVQGAVVLVALSYQDGKSDRVAPAEAATFAEQVVDGLKARGAERVIIVGPSATHLTPGRPVVPGYGSYARWLKRTDKAIREKVGNAALYVSLGDMPEVLNGDASAPLTSDGVRLTARGFNWIAERVADRLLEG